MKDQQLKKLIACILVSLFAAAKSSAVSLDDIQFWTGSGTNRAALVVEWKTPESDLFSTVPPLVANKSLVWGCRFNGTPTGTQMLTAILAADPRLYVIADETYGTYVEAIGYDLTGAGLAGITDGATTNFFTNNFLTSFTVDVDAVAPMNTNVLFWSGFDGPSWEFWTELGDAGGFLNCPDRGTNSYWSADDPNNPYSGVHGQWEYAQAGLDYLTLTNGSWIGFSITAGEYEDDVTAPYNSHKHAPALPDTSITALIKNFSGTLQDGHWQAQFGSVSNWNYTLQRSADLLTWTNVSAAASGNGANLLLQDMNFPSDKMFYRVRANLP
jgi:hypothetical protein